jgi:hypothetical protein
MQLQTTTYYSPVDRSRGNREGSSCDADAEVVDWSSPLEPICLQHPRLRTTSLLWQLDRVISFALGLAYFKVPAAALILIRPCHPTRRGHRSKTAMCPFASVNAPSPVRIIPPLSHIQPHPSVRPSYLSRYVRLL